MDLARNCHNVCVCGGGGVICFLNKNLVGGFVCEWVFEYKKTMDGQAVKEKEGYNQSNKIRKEF